MTPITIVAHPDRHNMAEKLAQQVDADICWDAKAVAGTPVDHITGCALTHLDALKKFASAVSEWVVVLEDDAVPIPNFQMHLAQALAAAPCSLVGLYLGSGNPSGEAQRQIRQAVVTAQERNLAWLLADCLIGSVGYAVRAELIPDLIGFIENRDEELPLRISRWAQDRDIDICYAQPSPLNHDDGDSIGRPWRGPAYRGRKAWSYGTRNNWNTGSVRLGYCPIWSKPKEA